MDDREGRIVQRTGAKEKRIVAEASSHDSDKGNNSGLHDELYFEEGDEFSPKGGEKFMTWKGQRRGSAAHTYRSRWPGGQRMSRSFGRSRQQGVREEDLDEGEIFELDSENLEGNDATYDWGGGKRREFASDGSLFVEEYVLDDESLQANLQRYNTKYQRGRGGYSRPSSSRSRKSYERQRQYEKYEIIDEKTFGNYASHSRTRSPHYRDNENYRESFETEGNHGSREWSKRSWTRDDNSSYHKKSRSPDESRPSEDKRYERDESGKQSYESRYQGVEEEGSPAVRRKTSSTRVEGESAVESRRRSPSDEKHDYSPRDQGHGWRREPSSRSPVVAHNQERSWSRNRSKLSPPAAYKRRSPSPEDNRRAYSPNHSNKRESSPARARVKEMSSPKKRGRSTSPHSRGRRDSSISSGKRDHSGSPVGRKQGKSSRKRERSLSPVPRKRGRSSSSSSSQGDRSRSRSDSSRRESPGRGSEREEPGSTYSGRGSGRSRDPRRSATANAGHAAQHPQDASWKQHTETSAQDYAAMHSQQQFGMDSSGMAPSSSALYSGAYSTYGAQPDMSSSGYHQAGHGGYDMYNYQAYYQQGAMQPAYGGEFASHQMQPEWNEAMMLPDMTHPPPHQLHVQGSIETESETKADLKKSEEARKEGGAIFFLSCSIKKEQKEQKLTLIKQREEYYKKSSVFTRELELLREQKQELMEEKSCDNDRILKENGKLQLEIQNKLKAINNVIDMLTGIIGDKKDRKEERRKSSRDEGKEKHRSPSRSIKKDSDDEGEEEDGDSHVYNYVYYDPEVHWCRVCEVFPRTAKEYLHHLHSAEHKDLIAKKKLVDMPWHKNKQEQEVPFHKGAPTKRTSIKGLQFLISVSAWYCKLCDSWIGDLHCVSLHLKSKIHLDNYKEFVDKNPKWELEWLEERDEAFKRINEDKSFSRGSRKDDSPVDYEVKGKEEADSDDGREGKISSKVAAKEKNKSTSGTWAEVVAAPPRTNRIPMTSALGGVAHRTKPKTVLGGDDSSESEEGEVKAGRSIRVSMRNKPKITVQSESTKSSWVSIEKEGKGSMKIKAENSEEEGEVQKASRREEKSFQDWLPKTPAAISEYDRQLLSNIKDRLKQKQEAEKEKEEEKEKPEEKERPTEREKYESKEKYKGDHERYERERSYDRDRSYERDWFRERDRRDRSRERKRNRSKRYGSISPRRRSTERRGRYDKKFDSFKERRRERDFRGDSRGDRVVREEKMYSSKIVEEEKKFDPFSKKEKKVEPKAPKPPKKPAEPTCPKTKLPFIGRMPLLKHIAKKKGPGSGSKGDGDGKGDLDQDGEGGVLSPSHDAGKESGMEEGKIEGVQDMDIDDDNSEGELQESQEKDGTFMEEEDVHEDSSKQEGISTSPSSAYNTSAAAQPVSSASITSAPTKVSRFGPLMEMSSGPKLLTTFNQPTGVQAQLCAPPRLSTPQVSNLLLPPGTTAESLSTVEGDAKPKAKVVDEIPLPKDFQDALNILFPEKSAMGSDGQPLGPPGVSMTPPDGSEVSHDMNSSGMVHHMGMMAHGIPGMHPMDPSAHHMYGAPPPMHMAPMGPMQMAMAPPGGVLMANPMMSMEQQMQPMVQEGDESMALAMQEQVCMSEEVEPEPEAEPELEPEPEASPEKVVRRKYVEMGEDELAMLGIDPEDMAAQTFAPKRPYP
ncbi:hypothetical protein J437_LFUL001637 [Ladona fulva]|uniref:U1-type domain-containing protein n=1 Tax=Ladona fulva TaxID=123851 RepID=A0A8K0NWH7_LADFU|nr:hypothetical protein J437_LFUL001637 [Ladona fulva]